jgi:alpha-1,6-mannosyltransferase
LVLIAAGCSLDLVRREARNPGSPVPILCTTAALFAIAIVCPPRLSHDLWSYAMVGRLVLVHHANPYLVPPGAYGHDAFTALVAHGYRHTTTPYGPLFTLHAVIVAFVAGSHPLLARLAFQASAAGAMGVALSVVWRATRSTSALALLGLHPVVACADVNGGHNDAFVGLGVLMSVVEVRRGRSARAGWWIAAALLVKVTAGLALLPIVVWVWARGGRVAAQRVVAAPLLVAVPVLILTPGAIVSLLHGQVGVVSRMSIWGLVLRPPALAFRQLPHVTGAVLGPLALVVVIAVAARIAWRARLMRDVVPAVTAAVAAWLVFGAYVLPWYTVWALAVSALLANSRIKWCVALQGAAMTAAFVIPREAIAAGGLLSSTVRFVVPVALVAMFVWALAGSDFETSRSRFARERAKFRRCV